MKGLDRINPILPDELIVVIFQFLEFKSDRDACALVCRRWWSLERVSRDTIQIGASGNPDVLVTALARRFLNVKIVNIDESHTISLPIYYRGRRCPADWYPSSVMINYSSESERESYPISDAGLAAVGEGFTKLESLSLLWCSKATSAGFRTVAEKCRSLKSLDLQGCYVGDEGLAAVGECCKKLEDLNLQFCAGISDSGMVELARGCGKTLKSLGVAACGIITDVSLEGVGSHCRSLETLSLDSEFIDSKGVIAVAKGCPLLTVLKLQRINVNDDALLAVGMFSLSLELLALYRFQRFTDKSLFAIGKGCKKLKSLALNDCSLSDKGLEAVAVGCSELTHLEVNGCHNIGTFGLESVGKSCKRLSELALLYCQKMGNYGLSEIGRGCKYLQALKLVYCTGIGDEGICNVARGCRYLKKLDIRRCREVGNKGIVAVGENCKFLTDLSLIFCDRVGTEALVAIGAGCSLHCLDVSGCYLIGDAGIVAVARGSPQLSYINVSVLKDLGDRALTELGDRCPLLKHIVLTRCDQITDVGLAHLVNKCIMLETLIWPH